MERILVIGSPGAGKTTLSSELSKRLEMPLIHLDSLFWLPGWKSREKEEFDLLLARELDKPKWIIDGNYSRTLPLRLERCDKVIWLDFSRWVCLWGALSRVLKNYGKVRPDMGAGCPERFDGEFLRYIWDFPKKGRAGLLEKLAEVPPEKVIVLKNRRQVRDFLSSL